MYLHIETACNFTDHSEQVDIYFDTRFTTNNAKFYYITQAKLCEKHLQKLYL